MNETYPTSTEPTPVTMEHDTNVPDGHTIVIPPRGSVQVETTLYEGNKITDTAVALIVSLALTGLVITSTLTEWKGTEHAPDDADTALTIVAPEEHTQPSAPRPFDVMRVEAEAVAVYDVYKDTFIYVHNADKVRPLASLTKIMTGLVAYESADGNQAVTITPYAIETEGDSGLFANETWRLSDLLSFTLVSSSNDGADAIAATIGSLWDIEPHTTDEYLHVEQFVDTMNRRAEEIGMTATQFTNPSGLDERGSYGGLGTAEDVARLLAHTWRYAPDTLTDTTEPTRTYVSTDGFVHTATNTNGYVHALQGLLGSKTGYTEEAGANLAVIYDAGLNHPVVIVVLGSSREGRFTDVSNLVRATSAYVSDGWYAYEVAGSTPTL